MGFSHTLWITYPNGSPYGYFHDAMKSDGVAKTVIFHWSRSLNTGYSFLPLSIGSGGILNIYWYGALDSHGVAACVYDIFNFQSSNSVQLE